jgi:hypothetical protein
VIWLWGLAVGLVLGMMLGVVWASRQDRRREQRGLGASVTDWGQGLAFVPELRREISRLRQATARLQADRTASLEALARVAVLLEREARRLPVQSIERTSGENPATDGPSSRSPDA